MALSEKQQAAVYVKVAGTLMVALIVFGSLHLAGVLR